jgi:hypothetical protein
MTRNEIIENLKIQFKKLMFDDASTQLTTGDGKNLIVMGTDAEIGLEIYLVNADNTQTPLENGDYILSDGRTITVADGKISDVKAPEAADAPAEETQPMAEDAPVEETPAEEAKSDDEVVKRIEALEQAVNEILQMLQGAMSKTEQTLSAQKELKERVAKFAEAPSTEKIEVKPKINTGKKPSEIMLEEILEMKNSKRRKLF